eukprot:scaffold239744_cov70-Cyclotella_meneghiniana.AAC.1
MVENEFNPLNHLQDPKYYNGSEFFSSSTHKCIGIWSNRGTQKRWEKMRVATSAELALKIIAFANSRFHKQ